MTEMDQLIAGSGKLRTPITSTISEFANETDPTDSSAGFWMSVITTKSLEVTRINFWSVIVINVISMVFVALTAFHGVFVANASSLPTWTHTLYVVGMTILTSTIALVTTGLL